jgi:hypothetical protein
LGLELQQNLHWHRLNQNLCNQVYMVMWFLHRRVESKHSSQVLQEDVAEGISRWSQVITQIAHFGPQPELNHSNSWGNLQQMWRCQQFHVFTTGRRRLFLDFMFMQPGRDLFLDSKIHCVNWTSLAYLGGTEFLTTSWCSGWHAWCA